MIYITFLRSPFDRNEMHPRGVKIVRGKGMEPEQDNLRNEMPRMVLSANAQTMLKGNAMDGAEC